MAKTRAIRRAAREAERAARIAAARDRQVREQRRALRMQRLRRRMRLPARPGLLAQAKRQRIRLLLFVAVLINVLVWAISGNLAATAFSVTVTLLIAPMLLILLVRNAR
jgi:hypothetical protein